VAGTKRKQEEQGTAKAKQTATTKKTTTKSTEAEETTKGKKDKSKKQKKQDGDEEEETAEDQADEEAELPEADEAEAAEEDSDDDEEEDAEGMDAEKKKESTLFVGNVPVSMTKRELRRIFAPYGKIQSIRFRSVAFAFPKRRNDDKKVRRVCLSVRRITERERTCGPVR
jgi:nucleolar protein 12